MINFSHWGLWQYAALIYVVLDWACFMSRKGVKGVEESKQQKYPFLIWCCKMFVVAATSAGWLTILILGGFFE